MVAILKSIKKNISQKNPTTTKRLLWGFFALQIEIKIYKFIFISIYQLVFRIRKNFSSFSFFIKIWGYIKISTHTHFVLSPNEKFLRHNRLNGSITFLRIPAYTKIIQLIPIFSWNLFKRYRYTIQ